MDASYRFANKDLCSLSFMIMSVTKCACTIYIHTSFYVKLALFCCLSLDCI